MCVVGFYDASSWCHPAHVATGRHHPSLGPHHPAIILSPSFSASMSCHHPSGLLIRHRPTSSCHHPFIILLGQYSLSSSIGTHHPAVIPYPSAAIPSSSCHPAIGPHHPASIPSWSPCGQAVDVIFLVLHPFCCSFSAPFGLTFSVQ